MRRKTLIVLIILVLAFIWGNSCLPVSFSQQESGFVYDLLRPLLEPLFGEGFVSHNLVRKLAHFLEFFALGALVSLLFPRQWRKLPLSANLCLLAALPDETIQIFSDRGDQVPDVWLDFGGAITGILLLFLLRGLLSGKGKKQVHGF